MTKPKEKHPSPKIGGLLKRLSCLSVVLIEARLRHSMTGEVTDSLLSSWVTDRPYWASERQLVAVLSVTLDASKVVNITAP